MLMLQKRVAVGLFALLLCHTLASAIVGIGGWWQAENDLSERLLVYRSVDSIVEFQIPLHDKTDGTAIARTTEDGFRYRGHYYTVVSLDVQNDRLLIAGLEAPNRSFWQEDLLAFLNDHLTASTDTGHKASQLLKLLLKEYSPGSSVALQVLPGIGAESIRIPDVSFAFSTRSAPIHSPPPQWAA
ncbi:hypothetical protein SAMN06269250_5909 [Spirosoma fluviale]|uniref:Uncharacterized protein n=2 Tax=Spirosoma fluviale TaxID=1597977 RepID=A0A286GQD2_9BACT|nr:hypothetical protein SAMN06269250_5909 [Spirosoma fluviale]